jgi:acyl-homoserine-lactone acylase
LDAWADGLNDYLATHPRVRPHVIAHFEPWMALGFTEGSIGGDVERINLDRLAAFYGNVVDRSRSIDPNAPTPDPQGSNGIAIAPSNTLDHHALLLINPHTSFYFRSELQRRRPRRLRCRDVGTILRLTRVSMGTRSPITRYAPIARENSAP